MPVNQNHTYQDIVLNLGETWTLQGTLNVNNAPLPVDGNTQVRWKLANSKIIVLDLSLTSDVSITNQASAAYQIVVPVSQQLSTAALIPGLYYYELSAMLSDGTISIQAEGRATINTSLSYKYPT